MDEAGIWAQVLYPNVGGFGSENFLKIEDDELKLLCVSAYNDFLLEWASADQRRLLPIVATPFWDVDETVREIERCAALGARGILFTGEPQRFGLPDHRRPALGPALGGRPGRRAPDPLPHRQRRRHHRALRRPIATRTTASRARRRTRRSTLFMKNGVQCCDLITSRRAAPLPRVEVRVGGERHRVAAVHARSGRLQLARRVPARTRAQCRTTSSRRTCSARACTSRTGSSRSRRSTSSTRSRSTTCCSRPTSRTPRVCSGTSRRRSKPGSATSTTTTRRKILWDNAARLYAIEAPPATWPVKGEAP